MASLEVGIVGLPNSGKTSLFNALTGSRAEITSYAAVQASANVGIAAVPDDRIDALAQAVSARERVPATVQFSDVAGLVRGSGARDGGLGGEYLGHLRATHALAHVVRCFDDEAVSHPDGRIDPVADAEAVDFELLLSDQVLVTRRKERTERAARVGEKSARDELVVLDRLAAHLDEGLPGAHARRRGARGPRPAHHQARDLRRQRLRGGRARARRRADRLRDASTARRSSRSPRASRPSWPSSTTPPTAPRSSPTSASTSRACRASRAPASARSG